MNTGVDGTEMQNEEIHFRQLYSNQNVTEVYGAYNFLVVFDGEVAGPMPSPSLDNSDQHITIIDGIKIYPNPSSTIFNFELNTLTTGTLTLMDASGRIVSEQKLENQKSVKIDVRLFDSGIYFYKIQTNNDTKSGCVIIGQQ
jgi:hypothetical protein